MSLNTKIRKRVAFTPIMLSTIDTTKRLNPFVRLIAPTINSCATNVNYQNYAKREMISPTSSSEKVSTLKEWIHLKTVIRSKAKVISYL